MKNLRICRLCYLLMAATFLSGCATTTTASYEQQMRQQERKAAWDQLTPYEKAWGYLVTWTMDLLYGMGGAGVSF